MGNTQSLPCTHCPNNGGNPVQPTKAAASSAGLLTGEVRGRSFTGAYTNRSLSAHPDMPTIPLIAFMMIVLYHIPIGRVCQFFSKGFQKEVISEKKWKKREGFVKKGNNILRFLIFHQILRYKNFWRLFCFFVLRQATLASPFCGRGGCPRGRSPCNFRAIKL